MITIYKYPLPFPCDDCELLLPEGAEILTIGLQNGEVQLWAKVDTEAKPVKRWIRFAGTGHNLTGEEIVRYVSTFFLQGGALVFHTFEIEL
jgi:hypothetical protein